jgi:hypothetical protein
VYFDDPGRGRYGWIAALDREAACLFRGHRCSDNHRPMQYAGRPFGVGASDAMA